MTHPSFSGKAFPALFHEVLNAYPRFIAPKLAAEGFDDMPSAGLFILGTITLGGPPAADLMPLLGLGRHEADEITDTLINRGYLEHRAGPGEAGPRIAITGRGRAAVNLLDGIRGARWRDFAFRPGDIIISTPPKSGTTWVQMICALLIFRNPDLPAPLSELSPWLDDWVAIPRDEVYARLAAQQHRRFIKTHMTLSEIPAEPQITYIIVARHPLDIAISWYYQRDNIKDASLSQSVDVQFPDKKSRRPVYEWLLWWINASPDKPNSSNMPSVIRHLSDAWSRRHQPNVLLLHYEDLIADLEGEMRRVAARLDLAVPEALWPGLVKAATFDQMRADADKIQPVGYLKDNSAFFRNRSVGVGRQLLSSADYARYQERAALLAPGDLLSWLHRQDGP